MRFRSPGFLVAWVAVVGTACATSPSVEESTSLPVYCENALQTCFEFCLCATGEADRCFGACEDPPEEGGGGGAPSATGGAAGSAGTPSGGGSSGAEAGGSTSTGGAPQGGSGGTGGVPAGTGGAPSGPSCVGHCGSNQPVQGTCFCDGQCQQYGDCCADYATACGGGSGGSGGATGGGGAPSGSSCGAWPTGAPGVAMNNTLPQSLSWQGFRENTSTSSTVSIQDYYDCDGSKGIHALMIITGQPSCGACKSEAATLEAKMGSWAGMGIKVITLMIGSVSTAEAWKSKYGLNKSAVLADKMPPSMAYSNTIGTPMHHIVDPRTMKVTYTQMGAGGSAFSKLEQLAAANKP